MTDIDSDRDLTGEGDSADGGRAAELKRRAQEALNQGLDTARYQALQARDYAGQQLSQVQQTLTDRIIERPIASALTALGAGVVIGLLLRGGRRRSAASSAWRLGGWLRPPPSSAPSWPRPTRCTPCSGIR